MGSWFMPLKDAKASVSKPIRIKPDYSSCRVKRCGIGNLLYCLVPVVFGCEHAERCGLLTFCHNPHLARHAGPAL
jgi:hypothetical protein